MPTTWTNCGQLCGETSDTRQLQAPTRREDNREMQCFVCTLRVEPDPVDPASSIVAGATLRPDNVRLLATLLDGELAAKLERPVATRARSSRSPCDASASSPRSPTSQRRVRRAYSVLVQQTPAKRNEKARTGECATRRALKPNPRTHSCWAGYGPRAEQNVLGRCEAARGYAASPSPRRSTRSGGRSSAARSGRSPRPLPGRGHGVSDFSQRRLQSLDALDELRDHDSC